MPFKNFFRKVSFSYAKRRSTTNVEDHAPNVPLWLNNSASEAQQQQQANSDEKTEMESSPGSSAQPSNELVDRIVKQRDNTNNMTEVQAVLESVVSAVSTCTPVEGTSDSRSTSGEFLDAHSKIESDSIQSIESVSDIHDTTLPDDDLLLTPVQTLGHQDLDQNLATPVGPPSPILIIPISASSDRPVVQDDTTLSLTGDAEPPVSTSSISPVINPVLLPEAIVHPLSHSPAQSDPEVMSQAPVSPDERPLAKGAYNFDLDNLDNIDPFGGRSKVRNSLLPGEMPEDLPLPTAAAAAPPRKALDPNQNPPPTQAKMGPGSTATFTKKEAQQFTSLKQGLLQEQPTTLAVKSVTPDRDFNKSALSEYGTPEDATPPEHKLANANNRVGALVNNNGDSAKITPKQLAKNFDENDDDTPTNFPKKKPLNKPNAGGDAPSAVVKPRIQNTSAKTTPSNTAVVQPLKKASPPQPSPASDQSSGGETFRPANPQMFADPGDVDFLANVGGKNTESGLYRESLYQKFDPCIAGASPQLQPQNNNVVSNNNSNNGTVLPNMVEDGPVTQGAVSDSKRLSITTKNREEQLLVMKTPSTVKKQPQNTSSGQKQQQQQQQRMKLDEVLLTDPVEQLFSSPERSNTATLSDNNTTAQTLQLNSTFTLVDVGDPTAGANEFEDALDQLEEVQEEPDSMAGLPGPLTSPLADSILSDSIINKPFASVAASSQSFAVASSSEGVSRPTVAASPLGSAADVPEYQHHQSDSEDSFNLPAVKTMKDRPAHPVTGDGHLQPQSDLPDDDSRQPAPAPYLSSTVNQSMTRLKLQHQAELVIREKEYAAKIADLEKKLAQRELEVTQLSQHNVSLTMLLSEFENTAKQSRAVSGEKLRLDTGESVEELIKQRDQAIEDLQGVENSFADLHRRYEKLKLVTEDFKRSEETFKTTSTDFQALLKKADERFKKLKMQASEKLDQANVEIERLQSLRETDTLGLRASLKRAEIQLESFEKQIENKNGEITELATICDELIKKAGVR